MTFSLTLKEFGLLTFVAAIYVGMLWTSNRRPVREMIGVGIVVEILALLVVGFKVL